MTELTTNKKSFLQKLLEDTHFQEVRLTEYELGIIRNVINDEEYSNKQARVINSVRKDYIYWMKGL